MPYSSTMIRFLCLLLFCLLLVAPACGQNKQSSNIPAVSQSFLEHLQDAGNIQVTDVSGKLQPKLSPYSRFSRMSYPALRNYYSRVLSQFEKLFPKNSFSIDIEKYLTSYSGSLNLEVPELHALPFIPITPETFSDKNLQFETLQTDYNDSIVHGLRVTGRIKNVFKTMPTKSLFMPYIPDVNARVLGFSHAQLLLPLSENLKTADIFDYNGLHDWSKHNRYKQKDQQSQPIALTNWAHSAGSTYAVSSHPDFALEGIDRKKKVTMTFFLWNHSKLNKENSDEKGSIPHFIFQIIQLP